MQGVHCLGAAIGLWMALQNAAVGAPAARPAPPEINVYAAASLRDVLQQLAPACEAGAGAHLVFNFGASNDLARQIEAGNKADLLFSADEAWMDHVSKAGLVDAESRRSLLSNRLVVVGLKDTPLKVQSARDLIGPDVRRISLANPEAVPAGRYAKTWLEKVGLWDSLKVRVLYEVPEGEGPRISYPVAAMRDRPRLDMARRVVAWLSGPTAAAAFEQNGFLVQD